MLPTQGSTGLRGVLYPEVRPSAHLNALSFPFNGEDHPSQAIQTQRKAVAPCGSTDRTSLCNRRVAEVREDRVA